MSRYIDADKMLAYISRILGVLPLALLNECEKNGIDIVRCKECRFWQKSRERAVMCCLREVPNRPMQADDFCSYGVLDKDINVRSKTEPQTDCDKCCLIKGTGECRRSRDKGEGLGFCIKTERSE